MWSWFWKILPLDSGHINTMSFVDFFYHGRTGRTVDGFRSSSFCTRTKTAKGETYLRPGMWDFNLSYGNANSLRCISPPDGNIILQTFVPPIPPNHPTGGRGLPRRQQLYPHLRCRWEHLREGILNTDSVNARIDSVAAYLDESQTRNFWAMGYSRCMWTGIILCDTYAEEIAYLKTYMQQRSEWLDANIPGECTDILAEDIGSGSAAIDNAASIEAKLFPNPMEKALHWYSILTIS